MEYLLSQFAPWFDPNMLSITAEPYVTVESKLYLRLTVIATDVILLAAAFWYCRYVVYPSHLCTLLVKLFCAEIGSRVGQKSVLEPFEPITPSVP